MNVTLRNYQILAINDIIHTLRDYRSVLFQMPTGTGKTTLFCEIVRKFITEFYPGKKVLIITHRRELVEQVFNRLVSDFHLTAGIISSNYIGIQSAPVQVASIQTLVRREEHQKDIFSLVIIDEAHHALASTYKKLWDFYPGSNFLGVTATPIRTNGEGFHDLFDKLITTAPIKWFIKNNYLSDIKYFASHTPDVSNVKVKAGDYDETELSEVMQHSTVMADLVQSYIDFALDKKVIVYAVNREHCNKIVEKFNSMGFLAKSIDTYTPSDERRKIVDDFRNNEFKILCNVNIFTEGFDCPDVDAVQLARPTKSLTLFLQQVGRCMRTHQNKQYGIVLDNAGVWKEHGLPKMDRNWTLDNIDKNICPSQKKIIGIRESHLRDDNEPTESKAIRLVEIGELDAIPGNVIGFDNIEKNLTDKKIFTMRERIEALIKKIQKFELLKANETDPEDIRIFDEQIKKFQRELFGLEEKMQPKRFEQVLNLVLEKCQDIIDNNEIFVDGDKDVFLTRFVEPSLRNLFEERFVNIKTSNSVSAKAKIFRGLDDGLSREQIAEKYHFTKKSVSDTAWAWENEKMFQMYREGNSIDSVAIIYGEKRAQKAYELLQRENDLNSDNAETNQEKDSFEKSLQKRIQGIRTNLRIEFPDGEIISNRLASETLLHTIKKIGIDKVQELELRVNGHPLISKTRDSYYVQHEIAEGLFLATRSSTEAKKRLLENISHKLGLQLKIEIL